MIIVNKSWVKKAQKEAVDYMEKRVLSKKLSSVYHLKYVMNERKKRTHNRYISYNSIEKYNDRYANAIYFMKRIIGNKIITAYELVRLHTIIFIYYDIQGSSVRLYNMAINDLIRNEYIKQNYICSFREDYYVFYCEMSEEKKKNKEIKDNRKRFKKELELLYLYAEIEIYKKNKICFLNTCSRCNKVSSKKWVHSVFYRKPCSMGNVKSRSLKEYWYYLCTGCRNKFRNLQKVQNQADENRYLINKLKRKKKNENFEKIG